MFVFLYYGFGSKNSFYLKFKSIVTFKMYYVLIVNNIKNVSKVLNVLTVTLNASLLIKVLI